MFFWLFKIGDTAPLKATSNWNLGKRIQHGRYCVATKQSRETDQQTSPYLHNNTTTADNLPGFPFFVNLAEASPLTKFLVIINLKIPIRIKNVRNIFIQRGDQQKSISSNNSLYTIQGLQKDQPKKFNSM